MRGDDSADRDANHAVVAAYAQAWQDGDAATLIGLYHDDFVLHYFGDNPLAGDHAGKMAALQALQKVQQLTNRKLLKVHDVLSGPGHAALLSHEQWERDGESVEVHRVLLYHIRDGKLAECWLYDEDQRTVDRFFS